MYLQLIIPHSHVHIPDHVTPVCTCSEIDRVPILLLKHQSLHLSITTMRTGSCSATYKCFEIHTVPTSLLTWHASIKNHNVQMFLLRCVCARAHPSRFMMCPHSCCATSFKTCPCSSSVDRTAACNTRQPRDKM